MQIHVVGAGVVGLSVALAAQARGLSVTVHDREGPAAGASAGNAGGFAFPEVLPLASPGLIAKAPRWLLDPLGPLSVPPRYALRIAPWLLRLAAASTPARVRASTVAQAALMETSRDALTRLVARLGLGAMVTKAGQLQLYESEHAFRASLPDWELRNQLGIEHRVLAREEIAQLQPGLSPRFAHAVHSPGWWGVTDPKAWTLALADAFVAAGGTLLRSEATALTPTGLVTARGALDGTVVLAAGARSHHLARTLGAKIPLETERGYNTTLPPGAADVRMHLTFSEHGFVAAPIAGGVRIGGAVELGGLDLPPNWARSDAMLTKAKAFLPGLRTEGGTRWMGFRPSLPDTLPAIGRLPGSPHVAAFGHGHLGLTQSAGTGEIVANLLTGRDPGIDLRPFATDRFRSLP